MISKKVNLLTIFALPVAFIAVPPAPAQADDWPQWRGPTRDGVWRETGILKKFPKEKIDAVWRTDISSGYSGPTVAAGRVYVTDRLTRPKQIERVHCFDEKTGKSVWSHAYDCAYRNVGYEAGPRASVLINDGRAYSLGAMGNLFCLDADSGSLLWQKDLNTEYQIEMPIWGIAASPVIEGNLIIVQLGGEDACLAAFDKTSGKEKWRALPDRASYAAPIVIDQAGQRVLVCLTGDRLVGLDPKTGKLHWDHPFKPSRMVIAISTPVFHNDMLLVTSFYDGALVVKVNPDKLAVEKVWRRKGPDEKNTDGLHCIISTPYLQGDHIYGVDSYGELRCLELATGKRIWENLDAVPRARWANIHFVKNAENVWMFNEKGELIISQLSPKGFKEISRAKLIEPTTHQLPQRGGVCWSHPAFANKHVFIRNDNELLCASLAAE